MFYCYFKKCIYVVFVLACILVQKTFAYPFARHSKPVTKHYVLADTIRGVIVDDFSNGIAGVKINVTETPGITVTSDKDGAFEIAAKQADILLFNHPAYNTYQYKVKDTVNIKIRLLDIYLKKADTIEVLYGKVAAQDNLGSIATIYTNQITTTPATIFQYAMTGRLPGLFTHQFSGYRNVSTTPAINKGFLFPEPASFGNAPGGDNTEITALIRGHAPVTIIDGVQREFSSLDFESIESISVLKDALSTVLLGQVSSHGIILVTTKKPRAGAPRLSFTAQTGIQEPQKLPTPLPAYQYAYLYNEGLQNGGAQPAYTADDFEAYKNGTDPVGHPDVNWFETLLRKNSPIRKYNLSLNGGSNTARYVVSLGYLNQQGMFKDYKLEPYNTNVELNRYTVNSNIDVNLGKSFNAALQLFGRIQSGNQPGATLYGEQGLITASANNTGSLFTTPNNAYPIYNPDGSFGGSPQFTANLFNRLTSSGYIQDYARDVMVNLDLTYRFDEFVKGLWIKTKGNLTTGSANIINRSKLSAVYESIISPGEDTLYSRYGTQADQSDAYYLTSSTQFWYAQLSAGIDRQFGRNNFSAMLFADQRQAYINFDLPAKFTNLAAKSSYSYNNKYFSELTVTYGGFDRYEPGMRFGWFYAGGLGWKISEESFIKDNFSWINLLKLRATYGKTGNANIGYFSYRNSFEEGSAYIFGADGTANKGLRELGTLTTKGATWEKAKKFNAGLDLTVLNNTLSFSADYYRDRYYDLMQQRGSNTTVIGSAYPNENIGINLYYGGEFMVTYQNHIRDFNYFITANTSIEQSKVIYQDEIARKYDFNKRTGQPVGMLFGYEVEGIIKTVEEAAASPAFADYVNKPGDLKYVDQDGDGVITQSYDMVPIGTNKPRIYYGATLGFNYKGFDFSVLIQGVHNRELNVFYVLDPNRQTYAPILNRWTPFNTGAVLPRVTVGYNAANTPVFGISNSFYQRSNNFIRIKNVDAGYNLPYKWVKRLGVSGVRIFANALNLFTFSEYGIVDPEVSGYSYPLQRVINTGVSIKL